MLLIGSSIAVGAVDQVDRVDDEVVACAELLEQSTLPSRWLPKWKSSPTTTTLTPSASTSTRSMNDSGDSLRLRLVEPQDHGGVEPVAASSSIRCSAVVSSCGADSGRTIVAGWRSKVSTTERAPSRRPARSHLGDDGLVAEVHAVVGADRDDGPLARPRLASRDR